jgi:hypothetical protein
MIEPTKQFITGRHAHNANPAGQQGKQSRIANVQHITPPVSSHVQQYNNVSINVDNDVLANHVSEQACIRCGGYILTSDLQSSSSLPLSTPATHSDISHCLFHLSIVDAHLKDKLTERQRLQLLHERTDMQGRHYCLVCNIDVDRLWDDGRGHGIVNAQSRQYISLCQRKEMFDDFYSNLADDVTVSDKNVLFSDPSDSFSFFKPCKLESSSSRYRNLPSVDNSDIDIGSKTFSSNNPDFAATSQLAATSPHLRKYDQRLYHPSEGGDNIPAKLKTGVSTTSGSVHTYPTKISEDRGTNESLIHVLCFLFIFSFFCFNHVGNKGFTRIRKNITI